jgi:hypothetical protein
MGMTFWKFAHRHPVLVGVVACYLLYNLTWILLVVIG